jgi:DNA-binding NarL/FixJ family response regulator
MPKAAEFKEASSGRRVFLVAASAHPRRRLAAALRADPDLEFCGEAASPASAPTSLSALPPECFVVHLPERGRNSGALIKRLKAAHPRCKILAVSTLKDAGYAKRLLDAGADGYILQEEAYEEVGLAIRDVLSGAIYLSEGVL